MRQAQVDLSLLSTTEPAWGLGWHHQTWGVETAVAHGGITIGQITSVQVFPDRGLAVVVLTNSGGGHAFTKEVRGLLAAELDLTTPAPRIAPDAGRLDLSELAGTYESTTLRWQLQRGTDDRLVLTASNKEPTFGVPDPEPAPIIAAGPGRFLVTQDGQELEVTNLNHAGESYLYFGRLLKQTGGAHRLAHALKSLRIEGDLTEHPEARPA